MIYIIIGCLVIIGFLGYKLYQKQKIDTTALNEYNEQREKLSQDIKKFSKEVEALREKYLDYTIKYNTVKQNADREQEKLDECSEALEAAQEAYEDTIGRKTEEINKLMDEQRQKRQQEFEQAIHAQDELLAKKLESTKKEVQEAQWWCNSEVARIVNESKEKIDEYKVMITAAEEKYISLLEPLKQYEKDKQAKLFYTIQLPDEYHDDIEFLLTTVAAKVQHPDIISKLVWSEYVKPNLDNTFKRIEAKAEPGIYKITNIDNGKAYIGKSTDVKKRIADHFKSAIGIRSIADQAVHHEILKTGFWNWTIEVITYCDKDKLSELEKYYIDFFQTNSYGYNRTGGGEG